MKAASTKASAEVLPVKAAPIKASADAQSAKAAATKASVDVTRRNGTNGSVRHMPAGAAARPRQYAKAEEELAA